MKQVIDESGINVEILDAYESVENTKFAADNNIKAVPTILKMQDNAVIDTRIGAMTLSEFKEFAVA
jgi:hypothetical protein